VTLLRDRRCPGWPDHGRVGAMDAGYQVRLSTAMTRSFTSDAHFTQYNTRKCRRLNSSAPASGERAVVPVIVFDVDEVPVRWRAAESDKLLSLRASHPGLFAYETRGGYRVIYRLPFAREIASEDDALVWKYGYAMHVAYLARSFGIEADASCSDWTRLFRVPRATRDFSPECRPSYGDPSRVGALVPGFNEDDELAADKSVPRAMSRYSPTFAQSESGGRGVLFEALAARGHVVRQHRDAFVIVCPNNAQHSFGKPGNGSTILYPPGAGQSLGHIKCLHNHCANKTAMEWLSMFERDEVIRAK
jgi:hypothetical protein